MTTLGNLIRQRREALGLSQQELAARIGVSRQAVQQWEDGKTGPKRATAKRVADALSVPASVIDPLSHPSVKTLDSVKHGHSIVVYPLTQLYMENGAILTDAVSTIPVQFELSQCFAIEVSDESMKPSYSVGDICIVDRTVGPIDGDDVLFCFGPSAACILRRYVYRGLDKSGHPVFDLTTPSPDYETLTVGRETGGQIVGVVVEHRRKRRAR